MPAPSATGRRKDEHLRICLEEQVEPADVTNGFDRYRFDHDALPEVDLGAVRTDVRLFGKRLAAPLVIGAMTGGTEEAGRINRVLAEAAQRTGIGLALGSQRRMLEDPAAAATYQVRDVAPDVLLFGNIGAVQLNYGVGAAEVAELARRVGADVMCLHLNPLQEAIQPEGDTNFAGLMARIRAVVPEVPVPVVLKEVGCGISATTARKIARLPVAGVEIAGAGGTSWARIEALRARGVARRHTGMQLATWGIPTAESLVACRRILGATPIVCSGGMRTGLEVAKALALGADAVAMAIPFLRAATRGVDAVVEAIEQVVEELRAVMFVTGCACVADLRCRAVLRRIA